MRLILRLALRAAAAFTCVLLSLSLPWPIPPVSADLVEPGQKGVSYCFQLENVRDFPDFVFLAYFGDAVGGHQTIEQDKCVSYYKLSQPSLFAIKRNDFRPSDIQARVNDRAQEKAYFSNNSKLIRSPLKIDTVQTLKESDPRIAVVDILRIRSIDAQSLSIEKASVRYTYWDGTSETLAYLNQNVRPESSRLSYPWFSPLYALLAGLAALLIVGTLVVRRLKR